MGTIGILGAGAWGMALAHAAARAGNEVRLWARDPELRRVMRETGRDPRRPPAEDLPAKLALEEHPEALARLPTVLLAVPAQQVRAAMPALGRAEGTILCCAKGLEQASGLRLTEVIRAMAPAARPAVLSGPSFAAEVAAGLPTAVTIAATDLGEARRLCAALASAAFRPYPSDDPTGVEIGGALKNVIAIAAGIVMGKGLGENARAAVVTRGLAELSRLALALGGRRETVMGLSGLGDLLLTATSLTSRNTAFGHAVGAGGDATVLLRPGQRLAEGAWTAEAACRLAARHGVELPIAAAVRAVVAGEMGVDAAIRALQARPVPESE